jgi:flagellum-specific ATP synthase
VSPLDPVAEIAVIPDLRRSGRIAGVTGVLPEAGGLPQRLRGRGTVLAAQEGGRLSCEVIGFRAGRALMMPFADVSAIGLGKVEPADRPPRQLTALLEAPR